MTVLDRLLHCQLELSREGDTMRLIRTKKGGYILRIGRFTLYVNWRGNS